MELRLTKEVSPGSQSYVTGADGVRRRDSRAVKMYQGSVTTTRGEINDGPLAVTIFEIEPGNFSATFHFPGKSGVESHRDFMYEMQLPLGRTGGSIAALKRAPHSLIHEFGCETLKKGSLSTMHTAGHVPTTQQFETEQAGTVKVLDISTDMDFEFSSNFSNPNAQAAQIINAASLFYDRLGIRFNVLAQHAFTSPNQPYTSSSAEVLLTQFQNYISQNNHLGNPDLKHLFTGKELDGPTLGVAYLGTVCNTIAKPYQIGLSQIYQSSLLPIITAHEIGHNHGADHDETSGSSLMYPSLQPNTSGFSERSLNQIRSYLSSVSNCYRTESDPGDPNSPSDPEDPASPNDPNQPSDPNSPSTPNNPSDPNTPENPTPPDPGDPTVLPNPPGGGGGQNPNVPGPNSALGLTLTKSKAGKGRFELKIEIRNASTLSGSQSIQIWRSARKKNATYRLFETVSSSEGKASLTLRKKGTYFATINSPKLVQSNTISIRKKRKKKRG